MCCVSYLCAELYSGACLLFLSCGLGAGSVHITLPLPALIFATTVPWNQYSSPVLSFPENVCGLSIPHTQTPTPMLCYEKQHKPECLGFRHSPQLPVRYTLAFPTASLSHLTLPFWAGVLELTVKNLSKWCHPSCASDPLWNFLNISISRWNLKGVKILEEQIGSKMSDICVAMLSLIHLTGQGKERKNKQVKVHQMKTLLLRKESIDKVHREHTVW